MTDVDELQPHEGPSETQRCRRAWPRSCSFNPTRVRLKPVGEHRTVHGREQLQPHEGPSETSETKIRCITTGTASTPRGSV